MLNEFHYFWAEIFAGLMITGGVSLLVFVLWFMESLDVYHQVPENSRSWKMFWEIFRNQHGYLLGIAVLSVMGFGYYYDIKSSEISVIQLRIFEEWLAGRDCVALNQGAHVVDRVFRCGNVESDLCVPSHRNTPGDIRNAWTCESGKIFDYQSFEGPAREIFQSQVANDYLH